MTFAAVATGVIDKLAITVTAVSDTKTYDGNANSTGVPTISPALISPDTSGFSQKFDNRNAGTGKTLTPIGTANDGNGGNNYAVTFASVTGTINKLAITVTAVTDTKIYDGTTSSGGVSTINPALISPDTSGFSQTFDNRNFGTGKTLTPAGSANDGNSGNNYLVSFVSVATGTINKLAITVTAVTDTKTYDGNTSSTGVPTIAPALAFGDSSGFSQTFDNRNFGTGKTLTATGSVNDLNGGNNYLVSFVSVNTGTINKLAITVTALTDTKTYDGTTSSTASPTIAPPLAVGDTSGFSQTFDTRDAGTGKTMTATGLVNDGNGGLNYTVTFATVATGVINKLEITVTAVTDTKTYDGNTSSTGVPTIAPALASGDTPNFTQTFDNRNAGFGKTLTPAGTVNDGNSGLNYTVTFAAVATGVIDKLAITVTAVSDTKTYDGNANSTGVPTISPALISPDTSGFSQKFDNRNAGTGKTLTPIGTANDGNGGNNYAVTFASVTGTINKLAITVTAVTDTKIYDGTTSSGGVSTINPALISPDTSGFSQTFDNRNFGTGKTLTPAGSANDGNSGNNYLVSFVSVATGTINKLAITVTAVTDTKTYDGNTSSTGVPTIAPALISPDTSGFTQAFDSEDAGPRTLIASGSAVDGNSGHNYSVTFVTAIGSINKALTTTAVTGTPIAFSGVAVSVALTATVSSGTPTPIGTVTFKDGTTVLGAGTLDGSGVATCSPTPVLNAGAHTITAVYGGSLNYSGSTSPAPIIGSVNGPTGPLAAPASANITASFTDAAADTHTCSISWDDGSVTSGAVSGTNGSGSCSAPTPHSFPSAGVYTIGVTVTDVHGGFTTSVFQFVVIYDPNAGFVTGGGWINSPAGSDAEDPTLTGKANFGFVSKYKKGSNVPEGETEFQFKAGDINFHSSVQDAGSLVISGGRKATYRGTGTVNGVSGYRFVLIAYDGDQPGGGGIDRFRIKITQGGSVIYDNRMGVSEDLDIADPTALGGGSIVIHK